MELLQLKYFQTVARLEHMTRAAEELRISQPALSRMIALLENDLNTKLFDRESKYIRLNENGKLFLEKVNAALHALEDGKRALQDVSGMESGIVELYVQVASHLLPDLLSAFRQMYPDIHFKLLQHPSSSASRIPFDLCLSSSLFTAQDTEGAALITEEICLAVPANHRFANRSKVRLYELSGEPFISLKSGKTLREETDMFCRMAGFTPNIIFESDDPATVRGLIKAGLGVAFIPSVTWGGSTGSSVVLLPIDEPVCRRTIELNWMKDRYLSQAALLFREFTIDYFAELKNRINGES